MHTYIYIHIYIHTYIYTYIHIHMYIYVYTTHGSPAIHTYIYIYIYIHTYIYIYIHTYMYTYIYTCTYMYTLHMDPLQWYDWYAIKCMQGLRTHTNIFVDHVCMSIWRPIFLHAHSQKHIVLAYMQYVCYQYIFFERSYLQ